ncbi:MAG: copper chaperone PCu(A)C [Chloroflexi bacterium]|nr:copper chaperone PCu(A)C [Chloroflexota bacterium]
MTKKIWSLPFSLLILLGMTLAACQSAPNGPDITIDGAWGRPSPKVATAGAFYLVINNDGSESDSLLNASSSACGVVELHESYKTEEGMMGMRPVEGGYIEIPAGEQVELKIGGLHIMCITKLVDFDPGVILPLTLDFENSGSMHVDIEIREP